MFGSNNGHSTPGLNNDYYKVETMSSTTENQYTFDYYSHDGQFNDVTSAEGVVDRIMNEDQ